MKKEIDEEIIDDTCDIDPSKICDSCGKCLESESDYRAIKITEIKIDK